MAERPVLKGNCHCERYRFELHAAVLKEEEDAVKCACGLCKKKGCLWMPCSDRNDESGVRLEVFCSVCGTTVLGEHVSGELKGMGSVNVRSLRGVDGFGFEYVP
ncbi:hypothetical protein M409DRAFT_59607 [Zasmidium cellare ATCC 36951]|uniref:CENP-V/GFA domain-containing protein n=1 Tax=Zasmidium cellare ATCC 36951 TaxID=1080233 RepID=A0A6A6C1S0_ZASCE|nr:uncharacterized protein M409DRAFT_59607 [Zasmidium cellare ATCC 36951]KAF2160813.1 hypothetical protein M409DRAFT_59607 [Zasmidium cellare ATCC 36951]